MARQKRAQDALKSTKGAAAKSAPITLGQLSLVARRKDKVRERLDALEAHLTGMDTTLQELAQGLGGPAQKASAQDPDERAGRRALIEKLQAAYALNDTMDRLKEEGRFSHFDDMTLEEALLQGVEGTGEPCPELAASFMYCAVRLVMDGFVRGSRVHEIVELAQSAQAYRGREQRLKFDELTSSHALTLEVGFPRWGDFFEMMDDAYKVLAGHDISVTFSEGERAHAAEHDPEYLAFLEDSDSIPLIDPARIDEAVAAGELDAHEAELNRGYIEARWNAAMEEVAAKSPEDLAWEEEAYRREQEPFQRGAERAKAWRDGFADAEEFCASYLSFRRAFFGDPGCPVDFADLVKRAVETVLVEEGRSLLADKRTVDEALYLLGRVQERLIGDGRRGGPSARRR